MRALKIFCIVFCLLSVTSAFTGIRAIHWSTLDGLNITKQTGLGFTLWSVFNALLFASAAYGLHQRAPVVWKLGWAVLIISSIQFMIRAMSSAMALPGGWVACVGIVFGGVVVTLYWGAWWNRQREYFHAVSPRD
jgi:hypothetical protein